MAIDVKETVEIEERIGRYRAAARMIRKWLAQDDDYDQSVWPVVEKDLEEARTVCREPDESAA